MASLRMASSLMILGLVLVALSLFLPFLTSSLRASSWTPKDGREHAKTSADLHRLAHERGHFQEPGHAHEKSAGPKAKSSAEVERAFQEAEAKYKEGDAKLLQAQELPDRIGLWTRYLGGTVIFFGLIVYSRCQRAKA